MDFQNTIFEFVFRFEIQIILQSLTPTQEEINLINFGKNYGFVILNYFDKEMLMSIKQLHLKRIQFRSDSLIYFPVLPETLAR